MQASPEFETIQRIFDAYKSENDTRLAEIERKGSADCLIAEKIERMDRDIDECLRRAEAMSIKAQRPALGRDERKNATYGNEHKSAFNAYLRTGQTEQLARLEAKAQNGTVGPDSGYLVPADVEAEILARMAAISPIRAISTVRAMSSLILRKAVSPAGAISGWTAAAAPSNIADAAFLQEVSIQSMELYAQPAATQSMLDDPAIEIESWIGEEIEQSFAAAETTAFVNGNGTNRPKGFLAYPVVADASWTWGNLGSLSTGVSAALPAANPGDIIIDLVYALKSFYRQNAVFVMNRKTQSTVRKIKDTTGNYIWQPPTSLGAKASLLNFPVVECEDMPVAAANSMSIAFGDFKQGYLVADRIGIRALRDPYSSKPYVLFYTTKRVGGAVQDFEAIKLLKFGV